MGIFKRLTNMKLREECWNIDYSFLLWINEHFKMYLEEAGNIVNLEDYTYDYKGKIITQKDAINIIINDTNWLIKVYYDYSVKEEFKEEFTNAIDEVFEVFHLVYYNMWW